MNIIQIILRILFKGYYLREAQHKAFLEKFPCPDCRPDLSCTYYYGYECVCPTCKRHYTF